MARLEACPGSLAMVNAVRGRYPELTNPYAASGTRIHEFLASTNGQGENLAIEKRLTAEEMSVARKCQDQRTELINAWRDNEHEYLEFIIEKRLWFRNGLIPRFSGQPDLVVINAKKALAIDYKTGRLEADPVADNLQLRADVVLLKHNFPELEEIDAAIIEPLVSWESERVHYAGGALAKAEDEILAIVDGALWNHTRTAGPHCKYCPARTYCEESLTYASSLPNPEHIKPIALPRGPQGTIFWERIKYAKGLLVELERLYTEILESEPDALPGYVLPEVGRERRQVVSPAILKMRLDQYLTPEEINGCAEFRLGKIEELIGIKFRLEGKELAKLTKELSALLVSTGAVGIFHDRPFIRPLTKREREEMKAKAIEVK